MTGQRKYPFTLAMKKTIGHEGGYVHDPVDPGGETIFGISRRFHPSWPGWAIVDRCKVTDATVDEINSRIDGQIRDFYAVEFWDRFNGDSVAEISDDVAIELFDTAVNMGITKAVSFLQESLNVLNRNQLIYMDLVVDGLMGPASLLALSHIMAEDDVAILLKMMNVLQGAHYMAIMNKSQSQERFARGWFGRVAL